MLTRIVLFKDLFPKAAKYHSLESIIYQDMLISLSAWYYIIKYQLFKLI